VDGDERLQGVLDCLEQGRGEILVPEPVRSQALGCIERMLDFVAAHPGAWRASGPQRLRSSNIGAA
jgi:quinolinate synthase